MGGYVGDGYGRYGDHGDDDYYEDMRSQREERGRGERDFMFRDPDRRREEHGAAQGNLMGAERAVRSYLSDKDRDDDRRGLAGDRRAVEASDQWRERFGREGHEGSYGPHFEPYSRLRKRHEEELDRDYQDWCREREQQFHSEFDDWRSRRRQPAALAGQQQDEMPALELSDAAHATAPGVPVSAEPTSPAGSRSSRRRGSSGSTPGETGDPTGAQADR